MSKKVKRLFEAFQPQNYTIEITPDRDTMRVEGNITITGQKVGRPSQRVTFHQHGLKVTEAFITRHDKKGDQHFIPSRISHHKSFDEVRLHADNQLYPGNYTITMRYKGRIQDGMHGIYVSKYEKDGQKQKLVSTQFESHHAREAFPCIDEPEAKATFDLTLVSPAGEVALGNTPAKKQIEKDGKLVTVFETTPKMSTYLVAFVYGELQCKEVKTKNGVDVRVWATKIHALDTFDFALETARRTIEFFDDYYQVPYPLAKCDHVAIPDFSAAAMENWGLITYRERCLLVDPTSTPQSAREFTATVICHELSHQWFGNLVTMRWWDNLWLNESFANVMAYVATHALYPKWEIWDGFTTQEGLSAIRRDSIPGVQAIQTEVRHPDEIASLFDPSIVYAKGGRLLNMLMRYIGEDDFREGLKTYFTRHAYGNTSGHDLWKALSEASGKDVAAFMNPWLTRSGFPVVEVEQQGAELKLAQRHFLLDPSKADAQRVWPIPLLSDNPEVPELLEDASQTITLSSPEFIRVNQGASGHVVTHYANPAHIKALAKLVAEGKLDIADRLMLLSDSSMLARAGVQSYDTTLRLLENYARENKEAVWDIMALVIADGRRFIDVDPELEEPIKTLIRELIQTQFKRLGWAEKSNESSQDTKLRATVIGLGVYAEHKAILARALELFETYKQDSQIVPAELRSIVLGAAVRNNAPGAFEYLLDLDESTKNVDLKHDILGALTLTKKTAQIEILLTRLKDADKVRPQDVDHWLVYLLRSRYARPQAWNWLRENWPWIEKTFGSDKSYDYFPRYAASAFSTPKLLEEYKVFFEPMLDQPALARNISMGIEEIANRVAWLERDIKAVHVYFKR